MSNSFRLSSLFFGVLLVFSLVSFDLQAGGAHKGLSGDGANSSQGSSGEVHELILTHGDTRADALTVLDFLDHPEKVLRYRAVTLNEMFTRSGVIEEGDLVVMDLFSDVVLEAEVSRTERLVNGAYTVTARAPGGGMYLVLSTTGQRSLGTVFIPERDQFFKIISDPTGQEHYLLEKRASDRDILECEQPLIPELTPSDIREQQRIRRHIETRGSEPTDMARIGVMVVYTTSGRIWANSAGGGIGNVVAMSMANAQLTLDNSNTRAVMELVHSDEVFYEEGASASEDLNNMTDGFGALSVVHGWRDAYGADLVALFADRSDVGGLAWLLNNINGMPDRGYSLTRVRQAATGYTHIHEMGHNMGLSHHADQNFQPGPTSWSNWQLNQWSAGWRWTGEDGGHYCSVMSYTSGQYFDDGIDHTQVPYYSNPDIYHEGVPTGNPQRGDNARTVRKIKHVIAAYRPLETFTLVTNEPDSIRAFDAVTGGTVLEEGGLEVTTRGIVFNSTGEPSLDNYEIKETAGAGPGAYYIRIDDLEPNSTYYTRAFVHTPQETYYGHVRSFTTKEPQAPEVDTREADHIRHSSAKTGGEVLFDGYTDVERGVVWSRSSNPTVQNNDGITIEEGAEGDFISHLTDLQSETTYYYRAYATNLTDTRYGTEFSLTTPRAIVYPSPATDILNVSFDNQSDGDVFVRLINVNGQVVKEKKATDADFDHTFQVSQLRPGVYYLQIYSDEEFPVWPVLINP